MVRGHKHFQTGGGNSHVCTNSSWILHIGHYPGARLACQFAALTAGTLHPDGVWTLPSKTPHMSHRLKTSGFLCRKRITNTSKYFKYQSTDSTVQIDMDSPTKILQWQWLIRSDSVGRLCYVAESPESPPWQLLLPRDLQINMHRGFHFVMA